MPDTVHSNIFARLNSSFCIFYQSAQCHCKPQKETKREDVKYRNSEKVWNLPATALEKGTEDSEKF